MLVEQQVRVNERSKAEAADVLTPEALEFLAKLEGEFGKERRALLQRRIDRQHAMNSGQRPEFLPTRAWSEDDEWTVAPIPDDLQDRRVEITGPTDRKMVINALNSGASAFMADFEDANSPMWTNMIRGQANLRDAISHPERLAFTSAEGKEYRIKTDGPMATLMIRPRGWHLDERHVNIDGKRMSASLFDFGLYAFHNAHALLNNGTGVYLYLPKLENHLEARLWNDVFEFTERELHLPGGTIRATVLIETVLAVFEMEEILYELQDHIVGLNAGRWDYIFSIIKKFRCWSSALLPDRSQVTMTVPFMRAYTDLLVQTCHRRGAHAIGGMAAFIPSRRNPEINEIALTNVREDKQREAGDGFDGTWVAHPDLVPIAREIFDEALGDQPHQKDVLREDLEVTAKQLLDFTVPDGRITEDGLRTNISVGVQYLASWLGGVGAAAINNLMEDTATAEICRAQIWQWYHQPDARFSDEKPITEDAYERLLDEEMQRLTAEHKNDAGMLARLDAAAHLFDNLALADEFPEFLTIAGAEHLAKAEEAQR